MNFDEIRKRYENDASFYALVNMLYNTMYQHSFTISELKDAAYFAGVKFESEHVRPFVLRDGRP